MKKITIEDGVFRQGARWMLLEIIDLCERRNLNKKEIILALQAIAEDVHHFIDEGGVVEFAFIPDKKGKFVKAELTKAHNVPQWKALEAVKIMCDMAKISQGS